MFGGDGIEMLSPQQPPPCPARFDEDPLGLLQITRFAQRHPEHVLESSHHQRIAHRLAVQLLRCFPQPSAHEDPQRHSFPFRGHRIQVSDHRDQGLRTLLDLRQSPLRFLPGLAFALGPGCLRELGRQGVPTRLLCPDQAPSRAENAAHQGEDHHGGRQDCSLVPPHELPHLVAHRWRAGRDRLVRQVTLQVQRQRVGRLVAPVAVLLQRLHHDPIEVALDQPSHLRRLRLVAGFDRCRARLRLRQFRRWFRSRRGVSPTGQTGPLEFREPRARPDRVFLADNPQDLVERRLAQSFPVRRRAGQEFIQEHAQRIDIAAGVNVERVEGRLFGAHVLERADELAVLRERGAVGQLVPGRLGDAEVDDLGRRNVVVKGDEHVRGLEVAVNDPFLVGVLHRVAYGQEQLQPLTQAHVVVIAVTDDWRSVDQLHGEVRPAAFRRPGVENLGDIRMLHHCQGLPFQREPGRHLPAVHTRLDDFQCDLAANGVRLLGQPDCAHAALADLAEQLVRSDNRAGSLNARLVGDCSRHLRQVEQVAGPCVAAQEGLDLGAQVRIGAAGPFQVRLTLRGRLDLRGVREDGLFR